MDPEDETGSSGQGQNLHDLQNYLSTFNKEIEPGDDVLSTMDVDGGDVGDLYSSASGNPLQEPGEVGGASQFSSGFYSEQGILDTPLSDESTQQIQTMVSGADRDADADMTLAIKQEVGSIDLEAVQAQIAGFGDPQLPNGMDDIHSTTMSQGLIMTSLGDILDPSAGKVIRIVSLGEEGQFLSIADGSQMQILNQDLGISSDSGLGTGAVTVNTSSSHPASILSSVSTSGMVIAGRNNIITAVSDVGSSSNTITAGTQLVALQGVSGSSQPQLVTLPQAALTTEALQMTSLLSADGTSGSELGYQTITILPSDVNQGDMNYVLIMAPQEAQKDGVQALAQVVDDLKQENQELTEELMEINGEMKRVLRVIPKKFITANFSAQLTCDYCDYTSPKRYLLTRHMKSHSDERPHKCKECERGFKTPASLLNHINTHTGTRPHKCKTCDAAFTTSGELVRHIRYRHTFEKPHRCPNCDYASVELSKLKRHMRSHTGERPYKCPHCPYASPDTYKLKRHLRIHTGEKPYECDICHAKFTQSNSLKAHKLIHSGNKPVFHCDLCPTTCGRKTDLKIHFNKLHSMGSPLECKKCGQVFSDRYSYKQHVRGHDVEKCIKCDECDFIANTERSFDQHTMVHTNGRKFECDICHASFNLKQLMDKHRTSCQLGLESQLPESRAKEPSKGDGLLSLDGNNSTPVSSGHVISGPISLDTLHKNLLQDIKDGKLGDVPQVVIVHPDGSLEEISSKGDMMKQAGIFSSLSTSGKASESANKPRESSLTRGGNNMDTKPGTGEVKQKDDKQMILDDDDDGDDDDDDDEEEECCETSQCEASTQAELESDTDSQDDEDNSPSVQPPSHLLTPAVKISQSVPVSIRAKVPSDHPAKSVTNTDTSAHAPDTSSDIHSSLLQTATTSERPTDSESPSPLPSDQTIVNSQQFVVVKGYTCLTSDSVQPTLVNVAVDKDSLMKMFASLSSSTDGGVQLLQGGLESPVTLSIENSQASIVPMTAVQFHPFNNIPSLSSSLLVGTSFEHNEDSSILGDQDIMKNSCPTNSLEIMKDNEFSKDETCSRSHSKSGDDMANSGDSTYAVDIFGDNLTIGGKTSQAVIHSFSSSSSSSSSSSQLAVLRMGSSDEQLPIGQHSPGSDKSVKVILTSEHQESDTLQSSVFDISLKDCLLSDHLDPTRFHNEKSIRRNSNMVASCELVRGESQTAMGLLIHSPNDASPAADGDMISLQVAVEIPEVLLPLNSESLIQEGVVSNVGEEPNFQQEKQKRTNRKRPAASDIDQSLVMTSKRIRKTLIKVSM